MGPAVRYIAASKAYGRGELPAVREVSLEVEHARFIVLLGPSGCGKTTLLKMTNRLVEPTSGSIEVNGRDIRSVRVTELRRHMGYVIQQVGLFPHLSVAANIATVPRLLHWPSARITQRIDALLELVGLDPSVYRGRYPGQLSGGQQQRVGLARALAADPAILLMDEPFGAIDAITRARLQEQMIEIQRRVHKTVLFVTHDVEEALRLADKLVIMREGAVVQYDTPFNVVTNPANDFVRELVGSDDILRELSLISVGSAMTPGAGMDGRPLVQVEQNLRQALSQMIADGVAELTVVDSRGTPVGSLSFAELQDFSSQRKQSQPEPALTGAK